MIKVGTLCYLVAPHGCAGRFCVTVTPLQRMGCTHFHNGLDVGDPPRYLIKLCNGSQFSKIGRRRAALPFEIIPIAPPGLTEGEDTRQPVREVA